jgi:hypothetical protein
LSKYISIKEKMQIKNKENMKKNCFSGGAAGNGALARGKLARY